MKVSTKGVITLILVAFCWQGVAGQSPVPRRFLIDLAGSPIPSRRLAEDLARSEAQPCVSVMQALSQREEFTTFVNLLEVADLTDLVNLPDVNMTLYAPTNKAFDDFFEFSGTNADEFVANGALVDNFFKIHLVHATNKDKLPGRGSDMKLTPGVAPLLDCKSVVHSVDNLLYF